ncbi:diguanylate cyclase (GGDEF)-like protein [Streptomyces sp. Amel2xB2]|uniref:GGDEF domain-containing protein n=1 Tax=Streptomyces sp. Amel2xB2 TaxID=1305829 RepID=UPI000DBA35C8|nr:GGDEF domain-containing protein [Streptomyces sp. Amel2xB2]RAJ61727.1 diguanylate cyclase (GGDEF)-like protein [Streptomyces sp. Amel2xB2]
MSALIAAATAAVPLAGWGFHTVWMRRQLDRARRDPLTGLPGRAAFERRAARMLRGGPCAVVLIDLDGFKSVNDTYGHAAGDEAIRSSGARLKQWLDGQLADGATARLGGDEFALAVRAVDPEAFHRSLATLHQGLCVPVDYGRDRFQLGASIGACWSGELPRPDLALALRRADEAMYVVKRGGGGWLTADGPASTQSTVNGRRAGRLGASRAHEGRAA